MIELTGVLMLVSSLHIGTGKKRGTFSETLDYIPGRTIRGMVGYYLHSNNLELFNKLRIDEDRDMSKTGVFFKDALPMYVDEKYLFSWEKIPGNDNERLIEFLMHNYSIEWIKTAEINKNDDGKTISITNDKNYLSLTLNADKTNVNLEIDEGRTDKFIVKMENSELNIYDEKNASIIKPTVASPVSLRWCKKCKSLMQYKSTECSNNVNGKMCLHEGKKVAGFITRDSIITEKLEKASVDKRIDTKCPITRDGHTSPGSEFVLSPYHIESISPKTKFGFRCIVEDEFVNDLKKALNEAGIFAGLGGYRSRGYGTVAFTEINESSIDAVIDKRASELSKVSNLMMVTNSPMVIINDKSSIIGFESKFDEYVAKTFAFSGYDGALRVKQDKNMIKQRITKGIAGGWSIKYGNKVSEIIPCIGHGSCVEITVDNHKALVALEMFGVGEMTNRGYGDVYFTGGRI